MPALRAVVVRGSAPIAPFGVLVDDCPVGAGTFGSARRETLAALGLGVGEPVDAGTRIVGPAVVLADDLWITTRMLRAFLHQARGARDVVRLLVPGSLLLDLFLPLQDVDTTREGALLPCAFVPDGVTTTAGAALATSTPCLTPTRELRVDVPVPRHILGIASSTMPFPLTSAIAMRVRHWLHVLRASHLAPQVAVLERATREPIRSSLRALLGLRIGTVARTEAWKRQFVWRGRNTFVHPSAVVEASILGDDVYVGPHAVVLQSVVGDGCRIEQRAHVAQSTLGARTFVSLNSSLSACVSFADADACANNLQGCVIGPRAALTSFARALDTVPGSQVRVADVVDGRTVLRAAGPLPCGVAFGPDSYVGAGVTIAAGRVIGRGVRVFGSGDSTLRRVDPHARAGRYAVRDGALHALGDATPPPS